MVEVEQLEKLREHGFVPYSRRENWRYSGLETIAGKTAAYNCIEVGFIHKPRPGALPCTQYTHWNNIYKRVHTDAEKSLGWLVFNK
jgi:hypothetical protein